MELSLLSFWIVLGVVLMLLEFLLPGLVVVFVGLGALTVALGIYTGYIDTLSAQLLTWFVSSTIYVFTLRLWAVRLYPSDTGRTDINEDTAAIGKVVPVTDAIEPGREGRVSYQGATWQARCAVDYPVTIHPGERVVITGRDNITWLVEKQK